MGEGNAKGGAERRRLEEDRERTGNWKRWGPYLAERQWGTVREDYSATGNAWGSFPFEHAHLRAYRWGEDGLLGFCDRQCRLGISVALWNGVDSVLKERLFGLSGPQGNHGEDCKELYYYLDSTPTHSYAKALYKYPQAAFPYERLREESGRRGLNDPEYEILDTGVFDEGRYFDVFAEYAKAGPEDLLLRITVANRGPEAARLRLMPKLAFRNTWIWGCEHEGCTLKPSIRLAEDGRLELEHETLGEFVCEASASSDGSEPQYAFTDNETNTRELYGTESYTEYVKDGLSRWLLQGEAGAVNPQRRGTIAGICYDLLVPAGGESVVRLRLRPRGEAAGAAFGRGFEETFAKRIREADAYFESVCTPGLDGEQLAVQRQAFAGLLWSKQFYHYSVRDWLRGDAAVGLPSPDRERGRNHAWLHLFNRDILSMPDKWEYPWFAAWDTAFHMLPFARIDPDFAKQQLILFLREWYQHPNGQLPAYEWEFGDVNPPVHAWACWQVYQITGRDGEPDLDFLKRVFQKLLLNFTWWVNRKDPDGNNIFSGGFLGLDNIGVFDRSKATPGGGTLQQADGTAWMAFYCAGMLAIALELAQSDPSYEDMASKFFEHFIGIADAMNRLGDDGLWDEEDGFYYDQLRLPGGGGARKMRLRSMVGLIPLFAVDLLVQEELDRLPGFRRRMDWYLSHRQDLAKHIAHMSCSAGGRRYLLAIPSRERLERVLAYLLDEDEFLSPHGVRAMSKSHEGRPFSMEIEGRTYEARYSPGDSDSWLFGGNSNWRGPVWLPVNYLIVESLYKYERFYGEGLKVELPTGSGHWATLGEAADEICRRLCSLFTRNGAGDRPAHGGAAQYRSDPHFRDLLLFYEYFHGDTGKGLGASHQTGWTALVANLQGGVEKRAWLLPREGSGKG